MASQALCTCAGLGVEFEGTPELRIGIPDEPEIDERPCQSQPGREIAGLQSQGAFVARHSFGQEPLLLERVAEVFVRRGFAGAQRRGPAAGRDGFLEPAERSQRGAKVVVIAGIAGREGDGPSQEVRREFVPARLPGDDAEHIERVGVLRKLCEDLPAEMFRIPEPPRLEVLPGKLGGLPKRDGGHEGRLWLEQLVFHE